MVACRVVGGRMGLVEPTQPEQEPAFNHSLTSAQLGNPGMGTMVGGLGGGLMGLLLSTGWMTSLLLAGAGGAVLGLVCAVAGRGSDAHTLTIQGGRLNYTAPHQTRALALNEMQVVTVKMESEAGRLLCLEIAPWEGDILHVDSRFVHHEAFGLVRALRQGQAKYGYELVTSQSAGKFLHQAGVL